MEKQVLRQKLLARLRKQPQKQRLAKSLAIERALRKSTFYRRAKVILSYVAIDSEVETLPILTKALADGKRVAVPVTMKRSKRLVAAEIKDPVKDLAVKGPFGIPEPPRAGRRLIAPEKLELILVPGIAFDRKGRRLGRGGGYFDRFLSTVPPTTPRIGLAFRFQLVKQNPWESHDQPVTQVITE